MESTMTSALGPSTPMSSASSSSSSTMMPQPLSTSNLLLGSPNYSNNNNNELEEMTVCGSCRQQFNDTDQLPKLLSCKHYFCLQCMRSNLRKSNASGSVHNNGVAGISNNQSLLLCAYCWKSTDCGDKGPEALPTYRPVLTLSRNFNQLHLGNKTTLPSNCHNDNNNNINSTSSNSQMNNYNQMVGGNGGGGSSGIGTSASIIGQNHQLHHNGPSIAFAPPLHGENCHTHGMPLAFWCYTCCVPVCRLCAHAADHAHHHVKSHTDAKELLLGDLQLDLAAMSKCINDIHTLGQQQRHFLLHTLDACVALKAHIEQDLTHNNHSYEINEYRDVMGKLRLHVNQAETLYDVHNAQKSIQVQRQRLQQRYHDMLIQSQLDDLIRNANVPLDFTMLKQALASLGAGLMPPISTISTCGGINPLPPPPNPILFLANYCMSQLYSRHMLNAAAALKTSPTSSNTDHSHHNLHNNHGPQPLPHAYNQPHIFSRTSAIMPPLHCFPLYYFNIDVNGTTMGRIVIEVRIDVAPRMAKNFELLTLGIAADMLSVTGSTPCYRGCHIFQCWEGESVITGDYELNNGRGGRAVLEAEPYFLPDDTKLLAMRGTVGMRRTQKRHDNMGMVGSQFRIILQQEMRGFTGIFGKVVEGLELVDKISSYGDTAGKPTKSIYISKCGKL